MPDPLRIQLETFDYELADRVWYIAERMECDWETALQRIVKFGLAYMEPVLLEDDYAREQEAKEGQD